MLSLLPLLLSTMISASVNPSPVYALVESPVRHVRTTDRNVERLLRIGIERSPTFAALMWHLNASDVIVYIERVPTLPTTLAGRLLLMPMHNNQRYLRIQMTMAGTQNELVALIGHELQHAVEVADAADVSNESALVRLYKRIGTQSHDAHCYETDAARSTARVVRKELMA